jgi:hypothetical protein
VSPAVRAARPGAPRFLTAGLIILTVSICISALYILLNKAALLPWWIIAVCSIAGIVATLPGVRENAVTASTILWNLVWYVIYSFSVIGLFNATYAALSTTLAVEAVIWAIGDVALCVWAAMLGFKYPRKADPFLAIFTGVLAVAIVLIAIALKTQRAPIGDTGAWLLLAAALAGVLVSIRALRPARAGT